MKESDHNIKEYKELAKQKRRILDQMKKHRKALAKARIQKKHINDAMSKLRRSGFAFGGLTTAEAKARVSSEIRSTKPEDIYPKDLEKKFDMLEQSSAVKYKKGTVNVEDIDAMPESANRKSHESDLDDGDTINGPSGLGVIDFGEEDEESPL